MKIKEIISSIENIKTRLYVAYRINNCLPVIKSAIKQLYATNELPFIKLGIESPDQNEFVEISSNELVDLYGMDNLSALLFLDDLQKANLKKDKTDLCNLLDRFSFGKNQTRMKVTDEMLEDVRNNSPEVWKVYQALLSEKDIESVERMQEYTKIVDKEI